MSFVWLAVTNIVVLIVTLVVTHSVTKDHYNKDPPAVAATPTPEPAAAPQYPCAETEPQAPRDVTPGATGFNIPIVDVIPWNQIPSLHHVNTHFHQGAEHKSSGEYDIVKRDDAGDELPGFYCSTTSLSGAQRARYDFQYCHDVKVGDTYEMHWVHSSNGVSVGPGLGGAFARGANPAVAVQAQVFVVVNDANYDNIDLMSSFAGNATSIRSYMGSTTGPSYNNEFCSPYTVSWHVDPSCHYISASSFDNMCRELKLLGADADTHPHGSRFLVSDQWVVPDQYVFTN